MKEIVIAFRSWQEARHFIQQQNLLRGVLWPGILYSLFAVIGLILFVISSNDAVSWMSATLGIEQWLQKERSEWLSFLFVMNGMMLRLVLLLFYFALFKNLILVVGAPAFAYLSEKTEALLENNQHRFYWDVVWKDAQRGIRLAIKNTGLEALYFGGLILLALIPVAGWITPLIGLLMQGYYFGFAMLDYSFARSQLTPSQSAVFCSHHKGLAIGNGLLFFAMHLFVLLAPAYAIIAATFSVRQIKKV
ncbi:MAG: EI24 domain-containing protein [Bacteroidetes bacterium]|nr:EI24 domain-containing protein [Bacteroidota bacterium]